MPISPNRGSTSGGTHVTITGTNLARTTTVKFGVRAATSVTQVSPTQVTAVSPSGTDTVAVTLTTSAGASDPVSFFYFGPPYLCSLSVASGPLADGNTTITGTDLSTATSVQFGTNAAVPTVVSDRQLSVTVPTGAAAAAAAVSVVTAGVTSNSVAYTYVGVPTATTLTPTTGTASGGTSFTLTGTNLAGAGCHPPPDDGEQGDEPL